jgi:hypothetical protein
VHPELIQNAETAETDVHAGLIQDSENTPKPVHIIVSWHRDENRFVWIYKNPDYKPPERTQSHRKKKSCASCSASKTANSHASDSPIPIIPPQKSILSQMKHQLQKSIPSKDPYFKPGQSDKLQKNKVLRDMQDFSAPREEK